MSDELETRTPTVEEAAAYWQWGGQMWQAPERFDRMIAKVKADALRDLLEDLDDAGLDSYAANEVGTWIGRRADRIEGEA